MALTASKIAACNIAKLRVECIEAGWAPGVRTIASRALFHSITGLTESVEAAESSSSLTSVTLAEQDWDTQRERHKNVHERIPFTTTLTSLSQFGENAQNRLGLPTHSGPLSLKVLN
jgi:hypothetical protein